MATKSKPKFKTAAVLTIFRPDQMDLRGRKYLATWLRKEADFLTEYGSKMAKRYTARYQYPETKRG